MNAEVAMKTLFSRLKAAIVRPRMAPPVPSNPAENPENEPPIIAFLLFGKIIILLFIKKNKLNPTRNIPKKISKKYVSRNFETIPPIITKRTEGIPINTNNLLFNPFLNKKILLKLLDKWNIAVRPNTE